MRTNRNEVYVLGSARTPFVKSQTVYSHISRRDLMVASLNGLIDRFKLQNQFIDDTAIGAVMNSSADFNLARESILSTTLDPNSPAYNVQRACGTGLETVWQIGLKAHTGSISLGIAGGVDTNSDLPIEVSDQLRETLLGLHRAKTVGQKLNVLKSFKLKSLKPKFPSVDEPRTHLSIGEHCELMVKEWHITRAAQDELALKSHHKAAKAYDDGFFDDLVVPWMGLKRDAILRGDTSIEKLSKLKPAFDFKSGTLTAGNSTALTDGSACVLMANNIGVERINAKPLARLVDVQVSGVDFVHGAGLLMAPTKAVAELLERNQMTFQDFDYFEVHEAFAGQVLCNFAAWESVQYCKEVLKRDTALGTIDRNRLNVNGSSLALGHPFAATGARIVGTLAKLLSAGSKRGLISICTAGGMGIAAIMESV